MSLSQLVQNYAVRYIIFFILIASASVVPQGIAATASSGTTNFTVTFGGGTCAMSASVSEIIFGGGELIAPSEIVNNPPQANFQLSLSQCSGLGLTPKIKISGQSTTLFGPALFRSPVPESASDGYGILLSTSGNTSFNANQNLAETKLITAKNWSSNNQLSDIDASIPLTATLTCGNCNYSGRRSGDLIASVTFDFVYD